MDSRGVQVAAYLGYVKLKYYLLLLPSDSRSSRSRILSPDCDVAIYSEPHRLLDLVGLNSGLTMHVRLARIAALVGYEFVLTFDEEISLFRAKNKRIVPMLLYLANRVCLVGYVVTEPLCIYRTAAVRTYL